MNLELEKNQIITIKDFLDEEDYKKVTNKIVNSFHRPESKSNYKTDPHGHWTANFVYDIDSGIYNLTDVNPHIRDETIKNAWKYIQEKYDLQDKILVRCYSNAHNYGIEGYSHNDSTRRDEWTIILYVVNDKWFVDWAGETVFFSGDEILKSVLPRKNTAVIFPSMLFHAARSVSRMCYHTRRTLMFKFRNKKSDEFEKLSKFLSKHKAYSLKHSGRNLYAHLLGTFTLLENKKLSKDICYAGGLHSIFGTNVFQDKLLDDVQNEIIIDNFGQNVFDLIKLFPVENRPDFFENEYDKNNKIDENTFNKLRTIEAANLKEQDKLDKNKFPNLYRIWHE